MKLFLAMLFVVSSIFANHHDDIELIKKMTGCYKVKFQSRETFAFEKGYDFYPRYESYGLEWVFVDSEEDNRVSLQHLLIVGPKTIVKHWRQDWIYENTELLHFKGDSVWTKKRMSSYEAQGMWTQKVYQVDDGPRYECSAPWISYGSKHYWECETNSPLPRREFSVRDDYNVLVRGNRHELTDYGWVHDQDNTKLFSRHGVQKKIAMEKSYNTYTKLDDDICKDAQTWWQDHKRFWFDVREVWSAVTEENEVLAFKGKVNGTPLWQKLFELDDLSTRDGRYNSSLIQKKVRQAIEGHLH